MSRLHVTVRLRSADLTRESSTRAASPFGWRTSPLAFANVARLLASEAVANTRQGVCPARARETAAAVIKTTRPGRISLSAFIGFSFPAARQSRGSCFPSWHGVDSQGRRSRQEAGGVSWLEASPDPS